MENEMISLVTLANYESLTQLAAGLYFGGTIFREIRNPRLLVLERALDKTEHEVRRRALLLAELAEENRGRKQPTIVRRGWWSLDEANEMLKDLRKRLQARRDQAEDWDDARRRTCVWFGIAAILVLAMTGYYKGVGPNALALPVDRMTHLNEQLSLIWLYLEIGLYSGLILSLLDALFADFRVWRDLWQLRKLKGSVTRSMIEAPLEP